MRKNRPVRRNHRCVIEPLETRLLLAAQIVADVYPGNLSSNPTSLTDVNGTLYFGAIDGLGRELWKTDGTRGGTVLVKDINANTTGYPGSDPGQMTALNGQLIFRAYNGAQSTLFRSDGTPQGTIALAPAGQT